MSRRLVLSLCPNESVDQAVETFARKTELHITKIFSAANN
jgi:hypothetical protein